MRRNRLLACDTCGCVKCECAINHLVSTKADTEHWDNRHYDPSDKSIFETEEEAEEAAAFLARSGYPLLAGARSKVA